MEDCIFCKIVNGDIPSTKVYEDDDFYAFKDIAPVAPVHVLVIPKKHIQSIAVLKPEDADVAGKMLFTIQKVAKELGLTDAPRMGSDGCAGLSEVSARASSTRLNDRFRRFPVSDGHFTKGMCRSMWGIVIDGGLPLLLDDNDVSSQRAAHRLQHSGISPEKAA